MRTRLLVLVAGFFGVVYTSGISIVPIVAQSPSAASGQAKAAKPAAAQKVDDEYTRLIKQHLQDPRITTELVDHLPASDTVPSPLKFLGRAVGTPGELTYAKDIHRYYEALAKAAPTRARYWKIGTTEEGRDIVALAIADEATIKSLDSYRNMLRRADRSAEDQRSAGRSSCCARPSRSTTRSAACTRRKTAGPRC